MEPPAYQPAGLLSALAPALLLDTASGLLIQNAWAVSTSRSMKAGKLLAHVLMCGGHGDRPVTLVGHSMGARLIFHCLLELCRHNARGEHGRGSGGMAWEAWGRVGRELGIGGGVQPSCSEMGSLRPAWAAGLGSLPHPRRRRPRLG